MQEIICDKETINGWQRGAVLAHTIDSRLSQCTLLRENGNNLDDPSVHYGANTDRSRCGWGVKLGRGVEGVRVWSMNSSQQIFEETVEKAPTHFVAAITQFIFTVSGVQSLDSSAAPLGQCVCVC